MLRLPRNLPGDLRRAIEPLLEPLSLERSLPKLASSVIELFSAADGLCVFHELNDNARVHSAKFVKYLQTKESTADGLFSERQERAAAELTERWISSGTDSLVLKDLEARFAAVSYSTYSWPYPPLSSETLVEAGLKTPRNYTLLLPISSGFLVLGEGENNFAGYLVLFFNRFPKLADSSVQLIITLPQLLSEIAAASLRHSNAIRASELASYAHDIKHHLLLSQEVLRTLSLQGTARKTLENLQRSLFRAQQRTNSLLLADKDELFGLQARTIALNLNELVTEVTEELSPLFQSSGLTLRLELEKDLPFVMLDPSLFPSAILNLLDNALKYTAKGGDVLLKTYLDRENSLILEIEDSGDSIAEEDKERIFDKHYRGSSAAAGSAGNGLGLYLVRQILQAHGARLQLLQGENRNKSFRIFFPRELIEASF